MASTLPSGAPSSKERKYDRQLRLWGTNGQNRLEAAHIALFGATATGCEILKNLVLPSVGKFTVIDDKNVEEADLGVNFFLDEQSLGCSRAARTAALLQELNPDVEGDYIADSLTNLLSAKPELFKADTAPFTHIVVVSPFSTSDILQLSPEIPTFLVHSLGFTALFRVAAPTRCIIETHTDSLIDLRLLNPWKELSAFVSKRTENLDVPESEGGMNDYEHGHVPYVLLLLKYLQDWKDLHGGHAPATYDDKDLLRVMVRDKMRTNVPGGSEENYEEAIAAVLNYVRAVELSSGTKAVLEDQRCIEPTANSENFWIIAHAVREFINRVDQGAGLLPLSGTFPDMKSESNTYIEIQNLYRARAKRDATLVYQNVTATLSRLGLDPGSISLDEVLVFTKHANFIRRVNYRPISAEYSSPVDVHHKGAIEEALNNWDSAESGVHEYIAVRAWQEYYSKTGKLPGAQDEEVENDTAELAAYAKAYLKSVGHDAELGQRTLGLLRELVRTGGGELLVMASLAGGIVAQEIIKIITDQYVPMNNTVVFDGIKSKISVFEF